MNIEIKNLILSALIASTLFASSVFANPTPTQLSCATLPTGAWDVMGFATYNERQKNPHKNDISAFTITKVTPSGASGTVITAGATYNFTATCKIVNALGYGDLVALIITADPKSLINQCSGLYATNPSAMYIGGPSLTTGYDTFSYCQTAEGKTGEKASAYGVVAPSSK